MVQSARPVRQGRSRATRDRLLAAAADVFAEKGFERAALSEIASKAGCSVGSVYFRYQDKDALFQAALSGFLAETGERWQAATQAQDERDAAARERIGEAARFLTEALASRPGLLRGLIERVGGQALGDAPLLAAVRSTFIADLARFARMAGRAEPDFAAAVAFQMITGFVVAGLLNPLAPAPLPSARAAAALEEAVVAYLAPA